MKRFLRELSKNRLAAAALGVILLYLLTAVATEGYRIACRQMSWTPCYEKGASDKAFALPSPSHLAGTDYAGRDIFLRAAAGTSGAIKVGLIAGVVSSLIGLTLGALAGYCGGKVDAVVVYCFSVFAAMPTLLFILAFSLLVSKGFLAPPVKGLLDALGALSNTPGEVLAIYFAIGITGWVSLCRVVRSETMKLKNLAYVSAARSAGISTARIVARHIVPNVFHLVIIFFVLRFGYAIMTEVIISYLGLGGTSDVPSWGGMISNGQERLWRGFYYEVAAATVAMFLLVLALNIFGNFLRDWLDPRTTVRR